MPMPGQANFDRIAAQRQEQQAQENRRTQNVQQAAHLADTIRNFNDAPVGRIVGAQAGAPVTAAAPAAEAGGAAAAGSAAAAGGEAAGAGAALGEVADVAALAALA